MAELSKERVERLAQLRLRHGAARQMMRCPSTGDAFNALDTVDLVRRWEVYAPEERRDLIDALDQTDVGRSLARTLLTRDIERSLAIPFSAGGGLGGFRGLPWGAGAADVIAREGSVPVSRGDEFFAYEALLAGIRVDVFYSFIDGRLARGKYLVSEKYVNMASYMRDFDSLRELLIEKYASPVSDEEFWLHDSYRGSYQDWGTAVAAGHYKRFVQWDRAEGHLWLVLRGESWNVSVAVEYASSLLFPSVEERSKRRALNDL